MHDRVKFPAAWQKVAANVGKCEGQNEPKSALVLFSVFIFWTKSQRWSDTLRKKRKTKRRRDLPIIIYK